MNVIFPSCCAGCKKEYSEHTFYIHLDSFKVYCPACSEVYSKDELENARLSDFLLTVNHDPKWRNSVGKTLTLTPNTYQLNCLVRFQQAHNIENFEDVLDHLIEYMISNDAYKTNKPSIAPKPEPKKETNPQFSIII